jgi:hypothetical protein
MASFTFPSANAGNFATSTFYLVVVESQPAINLTSRVGLAEPLGQAPTALSNKVLTSTALSFDNVTLAPYNYPNALVGSVLCRQLGGSPSVNDEVIRYAQFTNALDVPIVINPGLTTLQVDFEGSALSLQNVWIYNSGAFSNPGSVNPANGLINLIGTNNGTAAYANIFANGFATGVEQSVSVSATTNFPNQHLVDRSTGSTATNQSRGLFAIDFGASKIRISEWAAIFSNTNSGIVYTLAGSNSLPGGFVPSEIRNDANWTNLCSLSLNVNWGLVSSGDNQTFWKYLRIASSLDYNTSSIREIEFFNSTIKTNAPL